MKVFFISFGERRSPIIFLYDIKGIISFNFASEKSLDCWKNARQSRFDKFFCLFLKKKLLASTKTKDKVMGRFLLDVVVGKSTAILQLFAGKDQSLLIWGNSLLVLNLGLDIFDGVRGLHFQGNGLAGQGLDEDLHTSTETEDQMQSGLLLDVVVRKSAAIFKLFAGKDQSLLIWGNTLLVLDLCFNVLNGV